MNNLILKEYSPELFAQWQEFIEKSNNGTIFHRLDFLGYHGGKFKENENHLLWYKKGQLYAIMPLGIFKEGEKVFAKSPFGASWGGLVHGGKFKLKYAIEIVDSLINYLKNKGVNEIIIAPTPSIYFKKYSNYFEFALYEAGFRVINREITSVIELPKTKEEVWQCPDSPCRTQIRRGLNNFSKIFNGKAREFYQILLQDKARHEAVATHDLDDLQYLEQLLPQDIWFDIAVDKEENQAGICYFSGNKECVLSFYLSQEDKALGENGLSALILRGLESAVEKGYKYYDFGTNNKENLISLVEFKESFGGIGISRDTYKLEL